MELLIIGGLVFSLKTKTKIPKYATCTLTYYFQINCDRLVEIIGTLVSTVSISAVADAFFFKKEMPHLP